MQVCLAGVESLAPGDPPGRHGQIGIRQHDGGALAAQLQGDRREMAGRRLHHQPAHPAAAGEEDVVERQLQQPASLLGATLQHRHHPWLQVAGHQAGDQGGRMGGVLRGFEHGGVAGRQRTHQGLEGQREGIVPGADDQRAAEGFGHQNRAARPLGQGNRHRSRRHPAPQLPLGEPQLLAHGHHLEVGLHRRLAQVRGEGIEDGGLVLGEQGVEALELGPAPGRRPREPVDHKLLQRSDDRVRRSGHHGRNQAWVIQHDVPTTTDAGGRCPAA